MSRCNPDCSLARTCSISSPSLSAKRIAASTAWRLQLQLRVPRWCEQCSISPCKLLMMHVHATASAQEIPGACWLVSCPPTCGMQIFEDSFHQLRNKDMRGKLVVHFQNEEGIDAGGVSREWFQVCS